MKTILKFSLLSFLAIATGHAQGPSPAEQALRAQLRTLTQRVGTAEAAQAVLQTEKADLETKLKDQQKAFDEAAKKANEDKAAAKEKADQLEAKITETEGKLSQTQDLLKKEQGFRTAADAFGKKAEAERAKLAAENPVLKNTIADQRMKNAKLVALAQEILERYAKFGLGTALTAREPFVGITRARLESMVEEYGAEVAQHRIRVDGTSPASTGQKSDKASEEKSAKGKKPVSKS